MAEEPTRRESRLATIPVEMGERGLQMRNLDELLRFANGLIRAGMVPKGIQNEGGVVAIIQAGAELGLTPMWSLQELRWINGKVGIGGDLALSLIREKNGLEPGTEPQVEYFGKPFTPEWGCKVRTWKRGHKDWLSWTEFTIAEAINAGLVRIVEGRFQTYSKGAGWGFHDAPWTRWPRRMLYYRPLGFHLRDHYGEYLRGSYLSEELEDSWQSAQARSSGATVAATEERDAIPAGDSPTPGRQDNGGDPLFDSVQQEGSIVDAEWEEPGEEQMAAQEPETPPQEEEPAQDDGEEAPDPEQAAAQAPERATQEKPKPKPKPPGGKKPEPPVEEEPSPQELARNWRQDPRFNRPGDEKRLTVDTQKVISEVFVARQLIGQPALDYAMNTIGRKIKNSGELTEGEAWYLISALAPDRLPENRQPDEKQDELAF